VLAVSVETPFMTVAVKVVVLMQKLAFKLCLQVIPVVIYPAFPVVLVLNRRQQLTSMFRSE
jgi:hypothetical protein